MTDLNLDALFDALELPMVTGNLDWSGRDGATGNEPERTPEQIAGLRKQMDGIYGGGVW